MKITRRLYWNNSSKSFTGWDPELKQSIEINPANIKDAVVVDVLDQIKWFSSVKNLTAYSNETHGFKDEFTVQTVKGDLVWKWLYNKSLKADLFAMWLSVWKWLAILEYGEVNVYYVKGNEYSKLIDALKVINIKTHKISFKELKDGSKGTAKWSSPIWEKGSELSDWDRDMISRLSDETNDDLPM